MEPGEQARFLPEGMNLPVYLQTDVLNDVHALFPVQGNAVGDAEEFALVSMDKQSKRLLVSLFQAQDQLAFVPSVICFVRHRIT
jgi:hypothetical protein